MQTKSLQTKRALRTVLLVLLLSVVGMGKGYAYDFSAVCPTGQTLYYNITDATNHYVAMVPPGYYSWDGFTKPMGNITIPETVFFQGNNYTITEIGNDAFYECSDLTGFLAIPNSVTTIGNYAFKDCSGLTGSLVIPNSVITIGSGTFSGCNGFTGTLAIPNSVTSVNSLTFCGCTGITSVIIGNSVSEIAGGAFRDCSGLTSVILPNSVTTLGYNNFYNIMPFYGCTSLTDIIVEAGNTSFVSFDGVVFNSSMDEIVLCPPGKNGNYVIPSSVKSIGIDAFEGCAGLTSITIPNSVNSVGAGAFSDCTSLTSITIPNLVTSINWKLFNGCKSLRDIIVAIGNPNYSSIDGAVFNSSKDEIVLCPPGKTEYVIPNSVTTIGDEAFFMCTGLTSVTIPNSVTTIGSIAFWGCTGLTSVIIPNSVTTIENGGDMGGCFAGCTSLSSVTILNSLVSEGMFIGCTNLVSVNLGNSVTNIGKFAFGRCANLTSLNIPNFVTTIGKGAFMECTSLASATIGNSVTSIGDKAFDGCTNLREINFNAKNCVNSDWTGCTEVTTIMVGDSVEVIKENMFSGFENLTTLTIGKSVNSIGNKAFANNPRLNMVYYNAEKDLEAATNVFDNCPNLTTIHIGPEVQEIGSNIFKGCNTVHFVVALGPTPAVLDAGTFSDIVDNSVLMVSCGKRVTYYSVWNMFPFNNIIEDCDTYGINVGAVGSGGTITPSVTEAQMGQEVQITITPNPGMVLVSIKVVNANDPTQIIPISPSGKAASTYSFTMPPFEVVVMATFKSSGASVDENNSVEVAVYPNPTNGLLKIEAENIKHITISNMLGQVVFDGKVVGDAFEYDFSGQKAGIYLVRIETARGVAVKKVSVTR